MKKLFAILLLLMAGPALAVDHASGFVSGTYTTLETGWSQGSGKLIGTSVTGKKVFKTDATIRKGHRYRYSVTTANVSAGDLQVIVGWVKHALVGGDVASPTLAGETPIPSNFNVAATLGSSAVPGISGDDTSAFRFGTGAAKFAQDDPMLYNGYPGAAHLHMFMCNTGVNAYSTFRSLRLSGNSPCGKANRSSYWVPAMIDGYGAVQVPYFINIYYKGYPSSLPQCQGAPDSTHIGFCIKQPNGLRYVAGHNSALPTSSGVMSPISTEAVAMKFQCRGVPPAGDDTFAVAGDYTSIDDVVDAGCPAGAVLYQLIEAPQCWDGVRLDSANHRDHMAYPEPGVSVTLASGGVVGRCPTTHPYNIPHFSIQIYWKTKGNASFLTKGWHLSSDEQMSPRMENGMTMHMDYWAAWDQGVLDTWHSACTEAHLSSSEGNLCDGTRLLTDKGIGTRFGSATGISRTRFGWSGPLMGNGTFTGEITAIEDGQFSLFSNDGFTGEVTAFSLTDITASNNHAPVIVTGSK